MKKINKSEDAVVGIVSAFLIVGLVVALLSVVQTQYVPKWMEEKEAAHMDELADQFARLKYAIDTHTSTKEKNTPISTSITLGSKEMPYLMSVRAFGQLNILDNGTIITITTKDLSEFKYMLGSIKYESINSYYIDQTYILESGAVVLSQPQGNTIFVKPSFSVEFEKNVTLYYNVVNISAIGGKNLIAGYGTYPIQTEFLSYTNPSDIRNVSTVSVETEYVNAWHSFFNSTLIKAGLNYDGYGTNYSIDASDSEITIEFKDNVNVVMDINYIEIGAQIAPGWVESRQ